MGQLKNLGLLKVFSGSLTCMVLYHSSVYLLFGCAVNSVTADKLHKITFKP